MTIDEMVENVRNTNGLHFIAYETGIANVRCDNTIGCGICPICSKNTPNHEFYCRLQIHQMSRLFEYLREHYPEELI